MHPPARAIEAGGRAGWSLPVSTALIRAVRAASAVMVGR